MISDEQLYSFWDSKEQAEMITCGAVYPESVMQGYQQGEQIRLSGCRIVRHSCGFAFIFGIPTARSGADSFPDAKKKKKRRALCAVL